MTSAECKQAIVNQLNQEEEMDDILMQFFELVFEDGSYQKPEVKAEIERFIEDARNVDNWRRKSKSKFNAMHLPNFQHLHGSIERVFDCYPMDDQLRAYVYEFNGKIIEIHIMGE